MLCDQRCRSNGYDKKEYKNDDQELVGQLLYLNTFMRTTDTLGSSLLAALLQSDSCESWNGSPEETTRVEWPEISWTSEIAKNSSLLSCRHQCTSAHFRGCWSKFAARTHACADKRRPAESINISPIGAHNHTYPVLPFCSEILIRYVLSVEIQGILWAKSAIGQIGPPLARDLWFCKCLP